MTKLSTMMAFIPTTALGELWNFLVGKASVFVYLGMSMIVIGLAIRYTPRGHIFANSEKTRTVGLWVLLIGSAAVLFPFAWGIWVLFL